LQTLKTLPVLVGQYQRQVEPSVTIPEGLLHCPPRIVLPSRNSSSKTLQMAAGVAVTEIRAPLRTRV
jgi:hypothetical protein